MCPLINRLVVVLAIMRLRQAVAVYIRTEFMTLVLWLIKMLLIQTNPKHCYQLTSNLHLKTLICRITRSLCKKSKCLDFERIFCQARQIFAGIIALFQGNLTKHIIYVIYCLIRSNLRIYQATQSQLLTPTCNVIRCGLM